MGPVSSSPADGQLYTPTPTAKLVLAQTRGTSDERGRHSHTHAESLKDIPDTGTLWAFWSTNILDGSHQTQSSSQHPKLTLSLAHTSRGGSQ